jgi:hypothetical protein
MKEKTLSPAAQRRLQGRYRRLARQLADLDWISQGSVMHEPPGAWRWTRKVKAKTVTVALSARQAELYRRAVAEHRRLENILREMREISQQFLQKSVPGVRKRKPTKHPKSALS